MHEWIILPPKTDGGAACAPLAAAWGAALPAPFSHAARHSTLARAHNVLETQRLLFSVTFCCSSFFRALFQIALGLAA